MKGEVTVSGSKNAALPILCASLLTNQKVTLENVPDIADVHSMLEIFRSIGVKTTFKENKVTIDSSKLKKGKIPDDQVCKMRASILILGGLMPRLGEVDIAFPGGCVLGKRNVSAHTHAFKSLGCKIFDESTRLHIKATKLKGTKIILPESSVTATENAVMAAVLASGKTEIRLAAAEPHVQDLCRFLNKMGAEIKGIGTTKIEITGVNSLHGTSYKITGDYLEAGTFAIAAAATHGEVKIKGIDPSHLDIFWQKFEEIGVKFSIGKDFVHILKSGDLNSIKTLQTAVYPGFPTDLQAPFAVLLTQSYGVCKIFETLFEGRLNYLFELEKMGARIELLNPHQALVIGPRKLKGIPIASIDIRAGAAMVIAALVADGKTEISNIGYIDRGYEGIDKKLRSLGADIARL